jgi:hypothetical protein
MKPLQKTATLAMLALTLLLGGCAATQKLSDEDRTKFKSASIDPVVQKAPGVFLLAPSGANIGLMFGAIGGAAAGGSIEESGKAFSEYLVKNQISIEKIALEEVEAELRASGKLTLAKPGETAPATIKISLPQYGFGVTHLLGSKVVPTIMLKCDMVDGTGKVLWSANERMLPSIASPMESISWEEMRDNPKIIEQQWRKALRYLAKRVVADL